IRIRPHDLPLLDALEPLRVAEDTFAAVVAEVRAVRIAGREVSTLIFRFAEFAAVGGVEALGNTVADRIHRCHVGFNRGYGTLSSTVVSVAPDEDAADEHARRSRHLSETRVQVHEDRPFLGRRASGGALSSALLA